MKSPTIKLPAPTTSSRFSTQRPRFYTFPPALVAGVLFCLQTAGQANPPPPNASRPAGIAILPVPAGNEQPFATPFDSTTGQWLSGATDLLAWDAPNQVWVAYHFDGTGWVDEKGAAYPAPRAGEVVVPRTGEPGGLRVMFSGAIPVEARRAQTLFPGLNLTGNPFNLQTGPLAATWREVEGLEPVVEKTANPGSPWKENPRAPSLVPVRLGPDGQSAEFQIHPGGFTRQSLGIFSILLLDGKPWDAHGVWAFEATLPPSAKPTVWTDRFPVADRSAVVKLYVVAPLGVDGAVPDDSALAAFGLRDIDRKAARGLLKTAGEQREFEDLGRRRAALNELAAVRAFEDSLKPGAVPLLQVNSPQEGAVQAHATKARSMRASGYQRPDDIPLERKLANPELR